MTSTIIDKTPITERRHKQEINWRTQIDRQTNKQMENRRKDRASWTFEDIGRQIDMDKIQKKKQINRHTERRTGTSYCRMKDGKTERRRGMKTWTDRLTDRQTD